MIKRTKKSLEIKIHGYRKMGFSNRLESINTDMKLSYIVDENLEDLLLLLKVKIRKNAAGVPKGFILIQKNNSIEATNGVISLYLKDDELPIVNDKIDKLDKIKKLLKDKEIKMITRNIELEL